MAADDSKLIAAAEAVRANAYAPYSNYHVGAAVLDDNGNVHTGCNVENASFPEGVCAEANAIGTMVSEGGSKIVAIAVVGGDEGVELAGGAGTVSACTPCGGCRQSILEFSDDDTRIILIDGGGRATTYGIDDLLPVSFRVR